MCNNCNVTAHVGCMLQYIGKSGIHSNTCPSCRSRNTCILKGQRTRNTEYLTKKVWGYLQEIDSHTNGTPQENLLQHLFVTIVTNKCILEKDFELMWNVKEKIINICEATYPHVEQKHVSLYQYLYNLNSAMPVTILE